MVVGVVIAILRMLRGMLLLPYHHHDYHIPGSQERERSPALVRSTTTTTTTTRYNTAFQDYYSFDIDDGTPGSINISRVTSSISNILPTLHHHLLLLELQLPQPTP